MRAGCWALDVWCWRQCILPLAALPPNSCMHGTSALHPCLRRKCLPHVVHRWDQAYAVVERFQPEVNFAGGSSRPIPVEVKHGTEVMSFSSLVSSRRATWNGPSAAGPHRDSPGSMLLGSKHQGGASQASPPRASPALQGAFGRLVGKPRLGSNWFLPSRMDPRAYKDSEGDICINVDLRGAGGINACTVTVRAGRGGAGRGRAGTKGWHQLCCCCAGLARSS